MKGATGREILGQELPGATCRKALGSSYRVFTGAANPTRNQVRRFFWADIKHPRSTVQHELESNGRIRQTM